MSTIEKLSIVIPVYNEEATIYGLLSKIVKVNLVHNIKKEVLVINDCSTDRTAAEIERFISDNQVPDIQLYSHSRNMGKGAALHTGIANANGDFIVIQDADNEYDPEEFNDLLKPVLTGFADVVYGSRFMGSNPHRILFFWHTIGNKFLTFLTNLFSNLNLTDMETCYKMFNAKMIKSLTLKEKRFGFEPEVTIKISRVPKVRIYEIGISYYGRGYEEGKKIGWKDGFRAVYCILKYGLFRV
jgi:glycosyltransferase involved in cell wall biosynthesis